MTEKSLKTLPQPFKILALESSCDDTGCAILSSDGTLLAQKLHSQEEPSQLGGVVPEVAARAHLRHISEITQKTLKEAGLELKDIDVFAASTGPGLIGGLIVGANFAQGLALSTGKPFMAINHIEAHSLSPLISPSPLRSEKGVTPYLLLLASGGHCQLIGVKNVGNYTYLGGTLDDSCGEAFDKTAKALGLGWPGGPKLEKLAQGGNPKAYALPRPLMGRDHCDFSFSGLKTAVLRVIQPLSPEGLEKESPNIAASFQKAVTDILKDRVEHAIKRFPQAQALCVAGGVAANQSVRSTLEALASKEGMQFYAPPIKLCTDNAVMIAWAALLRLETGASTKVSAPMIRPRWPLSEMNF